MARQRSRRSGSLKLYRTSPRLRKILRGVDEITTKSKLSEIVWKYVLDNDLQVSMNKRFFVPDERLAAICGRRAMTLLTFHNYAARHLTALSGKEVAELQKPGLTVQSDKPKKLEKNLEDESKIIDDKKGCRDEGWTSESLDLMEAEEQPILTTIVMGDGECKTGDRDVRNKGPGLITDSSISGCAPRMGTEDGVHLQTAHLAVTRDVKDEIGTKRSFSEYFREKRLQEPITPDEKIVSKEEPEPVRHTMTGRCKRRDPGQKTSPDSTSEKMILADKLATGNNFGAMAPSCKPSHYISSSKAFERNEHAHGHEEKAAVRAETTRLPIRGDMVKQAVSHEGTGPTKSRNYAFSGASESHKPNQNWQEEKDKSERWSCVIQ